MDFGGHYYHAMDREYEKEGIIGIGDLGISSNFMVSQLDNLKAKIFQGAKKVELGFSGRGKGSMQGSNTTPEMYGKDERQAIKELSTINQVELSTHGSFSIGSLSGFNPQARAFDDEIRRKALGEVQRTVEFAADTARGGAIVFHMQEFPRAVSEEFGPEFRLYPEEPKKAEIHLVDKKTGQMRVLTKDTEVSMPVTQKDPVTGEDLPVFDPQTGAFKMERRNWDYYVKKSQDWNKDHPETQKLPQEMLYDEYVDSSIKQAEALAKMHSKEYDQHKKDKDRMEKALKFYERIESETDPEKRWELRRQFEGLAGGLVPGEVKFPSEYLKESIKRYERAIKQEEEAAISYLQQADNAKMQRENTVPMKEWAVAKTADTIAEGAMYAFALEQEASRKGKPFKKPLFLAPENLFPEDYGSHPDELREIIFKSRDAMVKKLQQQYGYDASKASEVASAHIKATLDTGHAYMWKQFFASQPGETPEDTEKRFNRWVVDKIDKLAKDGIIGNVHLHDNFGYYDEHVTPGQGKIPLKEIMQKLTEAGVKDIIVEPNHQDYKTLLGAWREFGHSIYGLSKPGMPFDSWVDVENRYFGRNAPPYFVVGDFRPSEEWSLWSQVPLE